MTRLGDMLVGRGLLAPDDIEEALRRQRTQGGRLGANLVALGMLTSEQLRVLLQDQRDLETALPLCRRALARLEQTAGPKHPNTSRARSNMARVLVAGGRAPEALPMAEAAFAIQRETLGLSHPWSRDTLQVIADARDAVARINAVCEIAD